MPLITKGKGKILMAAGLVFFFIGLFGGTFSYSAYGREWGYTPLGLFLAFSMVLIGPILCATGIGVFVVGAHRFQKYPSKIIAALKNGTRTKLSSLATLLDISENDVKRIILELQSRGEPIVVDRITLDVLYSPSQMPSTLSPIVGTSTAPSRLGKSSTGWTSYEKLSLTISIVSIVAGIVLALLLR
jgi:hypothetical protein